MTDYEEAKQGERKALDRLSKLIDKGPPPYPKWKEDIFVAAGAYAGAVLNKRLIETRAEEHPDGADPA